MRKGESKNLLVEWSVAPKQIIFSGCFMRVLTNKVDSTDIVPLSLHCGAAKLCGAKCGLTSRRTKIQILFDSRFVFLIFLLLFSQAAHDLRAEGRAHLFRPSTQDEVTRTIPIFSFAKPHCVLFLLQQVKMDSLIENACFGLQHVKFGGGVEQGEEEACSGGRGCAHAEWKEIQANQPVLDWGMTSLWLLGCAFCYC